MKRMRVVIVDDEPLARRGVRQLLRSHSDVQIVGEGRDGAEAVKLLRSLEPDVVFLDVQMPEMDGFEVLRRLGNGRMPWVIFVTAYDSFAVRAFEAHALDYLVKPLHEDRFHDALTRVRDRLLSNEAVGLAHQLSELLQSRSHAVTEDAKEATRLVIPDTHGDVILETDEIDWIEAYDYYAAIHARGRRILMRESLDVLEGRMGSTRFIRVHRSAIVNLARVREIRIEGGRGVVLLNDGVRVPLSRRRRANVAEAIRRFAR